MWQRLKVIENERKSVDDRQQKVQHFENDSQNQKFNIYKSHEDFLNQNKLSVVKDQQQNKQEMIQKLNQKLDSMFWEDSYSHKQKGELISHFSISLLYFLEYRWVEVLIIYWLLNFYDLSFFK